MDADGVTLLAYDEGQSTIEGTSWTATGVNNGREAVESTAATQAVTADFGTDGALSGFAGCNSYNAASRCRATTASRSRASRQRGRPVRRRR